MALVVPPGFALASFVFTGNVGTQPYVTTIGVEVDLGAATAVDCANIMKASYVDSFAAETTSALTLDRVSLYIGDDGPSGSVDSNTAPSAMTRSGTYPPTACSAIARKVTADVGRRGRGRMFLPGVLSESEVDQDGSVVSARRTSLQAALNDFYGNLTAVGPVGPPVLFHATAPTDPSPITGFAVSDTVGWIRGRIR